MDAGNVPHDRTRGQRNRGRGSEVRGLGVGRRGPGGVTVAFGDEKAFKGCAARGGCTGGWLALLAAPPATIVRPGGRETKRCRLWRLRGDSRMRPSGGLGPRASFVASPLTCPGLLLGRPVGPFKGKASDTEIGLRAGQSAVARRKDDRRAGHSRLANESGTCLLVEQACHPAHGSGFVEHQFHRAPHVATGTGGTRRHSVALGGLCGESDLLLL